MENLVPVCKSLVVLFKMFIFRVATRSIKMALETGVIPHSSVQRILAHNRTKKLQIRAQVDIEINNILDFVYSNLPPDAEKARFEALTQTQMSYELRREKKEQAEAERQRKYAYSVSYGITLLIKHVTEGKKPNKKEKLVLMPWQILVPL